MGKHRVLDKREYLVIIRDNFCLFCIKTYVVTPHLNRLDETVQMRDYNMVSMRIKKNYHQNTSSYLQLCFKTDFFFFILSYEMSLYYTNIWEEVSCKAECIMKEGDMSNYN